MPRNYKRILVGLAVVALEAQEVQQTLSGAEPGALPVGLQTLLQGADPAAPEAPQRAGLQAVGPQRRPACRGRNIQDSQNWERITV